MIRTYNCIKGAGIEEFNTLFLCLLYFFKICLYILQSLAAGKINFLSTKSDGAAGAVKGNVSGTKHYNTPAHPGILAHGRITEKISADENSGKRTAFHGKPCAVMSTGSHEHSIKFPQHIYRCLNALAAADVHAYLRCIGGLPVDYITGKPVSRNTVLQLTAKLGQSFKYRYIVTLFFEKNGCSEPGRPPADNADLPTCGRKLFGIFLPEKLIVFFSAGTLDLADRNSFVDVTMTAVEFAFMIADAS